MICLALKKKKQRKNRDISLFFAILTALFLCLCYCQYSAWRIFTAPLDCLCGFVHVYIAASTLERCAISPLHCTWRDIPLCTTWQRAFCLLTEVLYPFNTEHAHCSLAPCVAWDCSSSLHTGVQPGSLCLLPAAQPGSLLHHLWLCRLLIPLILWPLLHFARLV